MPDQSLIDWAESLAPAGGWKDGDTAVGLASIVNALTLAMDESCARSMVKNVLIVARNDDADRRESRDPHTRINDLGIAILIIQDQLREIRGWLGMADTQ